MVKTMLGEQWMPIQSCLNGGLGKHRPRRLATDLENSFDCKDAALLLPISHVIRRGTATKLSVSLDTLLIVEKVSYNDINVVIGNCPDDAKLQLRIGPSTLTCSRDSPKLTTELI
jgi:hypothetical protein